CSSGGRTVASRSGSSAPAAPVAADPASYSSPVDLTSTATGRRPVSRENFLDDEPWDDIHEDVKIRTRIFARRPKATQFGASLHELAPGSPGFKLHMHYGAEEMFFVVSGAPTLRTGEGEEQLAPGDVV